MRPTLPAPAECLTPERGGEYHSVDMGRSRPRFRERAQPALRIALAVIVLLLVLVPALDLAWIEPTLDQGGRCQLHANPAVAVGPPALIARSFAEPLLPSASAPRLPLLGSSVFIPPRA